MKKRVLRELLLLLCIVLCLPMTAYASELTNFDVNEYLALREQRLQEERLAEHQKDTSSLPEEFVVGAIVAAIVSGVQLIFKSRKNKRHQTKGNQKSAKSETEAKESATKAHHILPPSPNHPEILEVCLSTPDKPQKTYGNYNISGNDISLSKESEVPLRSSSHTQDFFYCWKCGHKLTKDSLFCNRCGTAVGSNRP